VEEDRLAAHLGRQVHPGQPPAGPAPLGRGHGIGHTVDRHAEGTAGAEGRVRHPAAVRGHDLPVLDRQVARGRAEHVRRPGDQHPAGVGARLADRHGALLDRAAARRHPLVGRGAGDSADQVDAGGVHAQLVGGHRQQGRQDALAQLDLPGLHLHPVGGHDAHPAVQVRDTGQRPEPPRRAGRADRHVGGLHLREHRLARRGAERLQGGADDARVGAAPAQVAVEGGPDAGGVDRLAPADQLGERDGDAREAVAALAGVVGHQRGLDRGAGLIGGQACGRRHRAVAHIAYRQRARERRAAADQHPAGTALLSAAAVLGAAVAHLAPQGPQQRRARIGPHLMVDAVDLQRPGHGRPR
jgi:hypothetical protein